MFAVKTEKWHLIVLPRVYALLPWGT